MRTYGNIASILFTSTVRAELLGILFLNPESKYYIRELSRKLKVSQGTVHRELKSLVDVGILLEEKDGNRNYFFANTDIPIYLDLRNLLLKTVGLAEMIKEQLEPLKEQIFKAFIFGSEAKGKAIATSDVDLIVVGSVDEIRLLEQIQEAEKKLGKEINYTLLSEMEFKKRTKIKDDFIAKIVNGDTIEIL